MIHKIDACMLDLLGFHTQEEQEIRDRRKSMARAKSARLIRTKSGRLAAGVQLALRYASVALTGLTLPRHLSQARSRLRTLLCRSVAHALSCHGSGPKRVGAMQVQGGRACAAYVAGGRARQPPGARRALHALGSRAAGGPRRTIADRPWRVLPMGVVLATGASSIVS